MTRTKDPNILAWKGTPGEWKVMQSTNEVWCGEYPICEVTCGEWGDTYASLEPIGSDLIGQFQATVKMIPYGEVSKETAIANKHLISASLDAVEFIADLLHSLSSDIPNMDIPEMIYRGEAILKKAYNL